jgi:thioredoxin 1
MNYFFIFVLAVVVLLVIYYGNVYLARFRMIGEQNPASDDAEKSTENWMLYYFHSPDCGACKNITPWVNEQQKTQPNVISVDISTNLDTARQYNIRATPTAVFVENNIVTDVQLGTSISQTMKDFVSTHGATN